MHHDRPTARGHAILQMTDGPLPPARRDMHTRTARASWIRPGLLLLLTLVAGGPDVLATPWPAARTELYDSFTRHIQRQIDTDKAAFTQASLCTTWFYEREKQKSAPPMVQPIHFHRVLDAPSGEDCLRLYPGGLESVRDDFHRTQTTLSFTLTFYEFVLVCDRNDDRRYNREELRDLVLALTLPYDARHTPDTLLRTLTGHFDAWHRARDLEHLMDGMSQLYEKGYRVSPADRAELDRVSR